MNEFTQAYIDCALWSSCDDNDVPLDKNYSEADFSKKTLQKITDDCEKFQLEHESLLGEDLAQAGHDFWLTRNDSGSGFWDGGWEEPAATILTDSAHSYGEFTLYLGDDGRIYGN